MFIYNMFVDIVWFPRVYHLIEKSHVKCGGSDETEFSFIPSLLCIPMLSCPIDFQHSDIECGILLSLETLAELSLAL